jgi:hypothetical protein
MHNYKDMTSHSLRKPPAARILRAPAVVVEKGNPVLPKVGQRIDIDIAIVGAGTGTTPITKIRFAETLQRWVQVPKDEAGMLVFFNNTPDPKIHSALVIKSIIPTGTACYADLVEGL